MNKVHEVLTSVFTPVFLGGLALVVSGNLLISLVGLGLAFFDIIHEYKKEG